MPAARPRHLSCPRCGCALTAARHITGLAWRCMACRGQSLNFSQFRRLVPPEGADAIWGSVLARPAAPREPTPCPECRQQMLAVNIPFHGQYVELAVCRPCQRLWLDRQDRIGAGAPG